MNHARAERAALCDLFEEVGPDAPTLCEGWTTYDLAAHLVLREGRLDAAPGIAVKPLAGYTASVQRGLRTRFSYAELVDQVRQGPPRLSPYRLVPGLDAAVNTMEFFVHHEDVRRARPDWQPRVLDPGLSDLLWNRLRLGGRALLRRVPAGAVLRRPDGVAAGVKKAEPHVVIEGEPQELLLYAFGRKDHARVDLKGDEEAIRRLTATPLSL
ncbi:TIGR03085 family metal-binding protein [Bailinhaonella thermotolerans]|uniref:TIGR03085 family metal-binding protein n=1 Tax=Bailinhaonella thermotolerans TaxID=1070861 RepID=UPI00192A33D6|nr:TIGR03085 family metal-binding protein [Bailinhaonella thermotolerans]